VVLCGFVMLGWMSSALGEDSLTWGDPFLIRNCDGGYGEACASLVESIWRDSRHTLEAKVT
jgi:hypothetical protein